MALTKIDDRGLNTPIDLLDNEKIRFGTGTDLEIYHDGTDSYLKNSTNNFRILADDFGVNNAANSEVLLRGVQNGSVYLNYDDSKKFETTSAGAQVTGSLGIGVAPTEELHVKNDTNGHTTLLVHNADTGTSAVANIAASSDSCQIEMKALSAAYNGVSGWADAGVISCDSGSSGGLILNTQASGIKFQYGTVTRLQINSDGDVLIPNDDAELRIGAGDDLKIYHNGTHNYIDSTNGKIHIRHGTDNAIQTIADGAVELYYDNSKKLETQSDGVSSHGDLHFKNATTSHQGIKFYKDANLHCSFTYGDSNANPTLNIYRADSQSGFPYGSLIINTGDTTTPTQALKLRTDKNIELAGNLIMASGKGIDFSAASQTSASGASMTAELLDDYEEGTWTPTLITGVTTYNSQVGYYTKVGRLVTANGYIDVTTDSSSNTDYARVYGLPFSSDNNAAYHGVAIGWWYGLPENVPYGYLGSSATCVTLLGENGSGERDHVTHNDIWQSRSSARIQFTVSYITTA